MLQFLQYKIFGRHRVPDGWIVVTAGNPPEYNNSVREFDIVTWDRLKRVDVEPSFDTWKEYAYAKGIHPAVMTYLEIKKADFYEIETTVDGKSFLTARGWSDLSDMIQLYEMHSLPVDQKLVSQYLQNKRIVKDFAVYYDLFNKYRSDYQVDRILAGKADNSIKDRARAAKFDERLSLLGLLLDAVTEHLRGTCNEELVLAKVMEALRAVRLTLVQSNADAPSLLQKQIDEINQTLKLGKQASSLSADKQYTLRRASAVLQAELEHIRQQSLQGAQAAAWLKSDFDQRVAGLRKKAKDAGEKLNNLFGFCEEVFPGGTELLILVTELTINYYSSRFISRYGCDAYFAHNKELLFYERQIEIIKELETLELN